MCLQISSIVGKLEGELLAFLVADKSQADNYGKVELLLGCQLPLKCSSRLSPLSLRFFFTFLQFFLGFMVAHISMLRISKNRMYVGLGRKIYGNHTGPPTTRLHSSSHLSRTCGHACFSFSFLPPLNVKAAAAVAFHSLFFGFFLRFSMATPASVGEPYLRLAPSCSVGSVLAPSLYYCCLTGFCLRQPVP